ncbi:hypothetical protein [Leptolyngbya sp. 7M]|uniref:hypothetical protein n=1 Tax=Leptolyngbya sp. 7M TaxID=2812896 RepID=UPI001B8CE172|nr:hypothetical protein [Leptolyngbya sp. 7M]QYO67018.1 hypothetical protein JVX88_09525 [Leptolyngbya sp. 7M]
MSDSFLLAGKEFGSRLIIGTGKYRSYDEMKAAHKASGAEMVTVAVNRIPLDRKTESFLDHLDPAMQILPNIIGNGKIFRFWIFHLRKRPPGIDSRITRLEFIPLCYRQVSALVLRS